MASSIYGLFTIVFILGCLWFLTYIMTKFIGKKTKRAMKSKYMTVVDSMSMGIDKVLYLVKIGEQYILMCSSAKGFEYICTLNSSLNIDVNSSEYKEQTSNGFSKYFDFFRPGTDDESPKANNDVENNLEKLRKLFNKKD